MDYKKKYLKYKLKYLNIRKLSGGGQSTPVGDKRSIHQILAEQFPEAIEAEQFPEAIGAEPDVNKKRTIREILIEKLFVAIENKDKHSVKTVLEQDPTLVNTGDPLTGNLPLNMAVSLESMTLEVVDVLLSYDVNVNARNIAGLTPLIIAIQKGHDFLIHRLLQDRRIDINYSIMVASQLGNNLAVVRLLGEPGADVNSTRKNGLTALLMAAKNGHNEVVNTLISEGADVNTKSYKNITPIMIAAQNSHYRVVDTLIKSGGDINKELMNASRLGFYIAVNILINDYGANAFGSDGGEPTVLMMAARNGHIAVVNILLEKGALPSVNHVDRDGYSALIYAQKLFVKG